jgi:hypothetical protein
VTDCLQAGGWPDDVVAPSAIPYSPESLTPREMTSDDITKFKQDWVAAVKRALKAGFDVRPPDSTSDLIDTDSFRLSKFTLHMDIS